MSNQVQIVTLELGQLQQMIHQGVEAAVKLVKPNFFVEEEVLDYAGAAKFLKCSQSKVKGMVRDGQLVPHRATGKPSFLKSELYQYLKNS
ncbi:helix-turn-helix domain-containing protein [Roseivirga pacifica]|uniref:helix-turn-helix domain-containing protein n=1 Tax=Roseivirga pacifica TaxID=1267423 RepID=UPI002094C971|nr:helix-turn-helix domain-containing protein [Roseivirga pacifica]MCO6358185.1 hypothetical protein [Roseivirga pacifica]MCO6366623.1 hypothetical protein [Roseivirga pacifica]MCO6371108.1 hypothetical protein [Roseivirga pacifica]MCO6373916.1 hypothetical protein [Roseivirga pacifica]MCO6380897.1 hypothetical protein [Roseivirga pacifica]